MNGNILLNKINYPKESYTFAQILHQGHHLGFLQFTKPETLDFWLRNPVSLGLLSHVQDLSLEKSGDFPRQSFAVSISLFDLIEFTYHH